MWIENETCVPKCEGEALSVILSSIPTTEKIESYATLDKSSTWNAVWVWEFSELFVFLLETHTQHPGNANVSITKKKLELNQIQHSHSPTMMIS